MLAELFTDKHEYIGKDGMPLAPVAPAINLFGHPGDEIARGAR
jgi:hypothetical protein